MSVNTELRRYSIYADTTKMRMLTGQASMINKMHVWKYMLPRHYLIFATLTLFYSFVKLVKTKCRNLYFLITQTDGWLSAVGWLGVSWHCAVTVHIHFIPFFRAK